VSQIQPIGSLSASTNLTLAVGLPLRNRESLTNLLQRLYDPSDPLYRHFLSSQDFTEMFGPSEQDYEALKAFFQKNGLAVVGTHPNRVLLDVSGSVADIQRVLHVNLRVYPHPNEARSFFAPDTEPSIDFAVPVLGISGLDNFVLPRPMDVKHRPQGGGPVSYSTGSGPGGLFLAKDLRAAYVPNVALTGAGQAVGLFELDGYFPGDISKYEKACGLAPVPLQNVLLNGFNGSAGPANIEVALDIEMAIAMAPGLSQVIVYEGTKPNDILNRMATDNAAKNLSSSWGWSPPVDQVRDQIFQQFIAQGQSLFQASGDNGAWPGLIFPPSDSPYLTVVGGTSLTTKGPGGPWASETTWGGSGGGISTLYNLPDWQKGLIMTNNLGSTKMRNIPDVALLADTVIFTVVDNGVSLASGGTSAAAPLWAAFTALVNQQATASCGPPVGFLNPALYTIGKGINYTNDFHDIVTGNNTNNASPNKFFAVKGYDLCTGWGTPSGIKLINDLTSTGPATGILPIIADPSSGSTLLNATTQSVFVTILGVNNATVKASIPGVGNITFSNNGQPPDLASNDTVYSASFQVPASVTSLTMTVTASATNRISSTNVFFYNVVPVPSNDNFANATKVPSFGAVYHSNNRLATLEPGEPAHDGDASVAASLWWSWTPTATTNVFIDTTGGRVDTVLAVYTGTTIAGLQSVASASSSLALNQYASVTFTAQAGVPYLIAVASLSTNAIGSVLLRVAPGGQPDTAAPSVFVSAPQSGLTVSNQLVSLVGTAFDPSPNSSGLKEVLINQNGCVGNPASGTATWNAPVLLEPGLNTLQVTAVDEAGNVSSPVVIQLVYFVVTPDNDFFAAAIPLTGTSGSNSAYTFNATKEVGEPNHAGVYGGKSVWWSFQPPSDGVLNLNTIGSSFDTVLAMYTGDTVATTTPVAANDDAFPGAPGGYSLINQAVRSNILYHIALDGVGGASGTGVVTYSFSPATLYHLNTTSAGNGTVQLFSTNSLGGTSFLPGTSADFAANAKAGIGGLPNPGYQFSAWAGDVASTANPLGLTITSNLNIIAQFTPIIYSDGFESGDLTHLPWLTAGDAPWFVQTNVVSIGLYAARSGVIIDGQSSSLILTTNFAAGPGSFDFKVSSEPSFDNLTFSIDGFVQQQWSGQVGWANFAFSLSSGTHTLNWTYSKDPTISLGLDAAFIDNVNLPFGVPHDNTTPAHLQFVHLADGSYVIDLTGQANQTYILQLSTDFTNWQNQATAIASSTGYIRFTNLGLSSQVQFYRAVSP
jgi:hypothetical protein